MPHLDLMPTFSVYSSETLESYYLVNEGVEVIQEDNAKTCLEEKAETSLSPRAEKMDSDDFLGSDVKEVDSLGPPTPRVSMEASKEDSDSRVRSPRFAQDGDSPISEKSLSSYLSKENVEIVKPYSLAKSRMRIFTHLSPDLFKRSGRAPAEQGLLSVSRSSSANLCKAPEASPTVGPVKDCLPPIASKRTEGVSHYPAALFNQRRRELPSVALVPHISQALAPLSSFMSLPHLPGR